MHNFKCVCLYIYVTHFVADNSHFVDFKVTIELILSVIREKDYFNSKRNVEKNKSSKTIFKKYFFIHLQSFFEMPDIYLFASTLSIH